MDCRTARHLLDFAHPHATELEQTDLEALDGHLAVCAECDALARTERQFDQRVARAMSDVPIPPGLRERLLQRLAQERDAWYRRWLAHGLRVLAAAAVLCVVVYAGFNWRKTSLPRITRAEIGDVVLRPWKSPPSRNEAEAWFQEQGVRTITPGQFHYAFLRDYKLTRFRDKNLPQLLFVRIEGKEVQVALVYILSGKQFDLSELQKEDFPYAGEGHNFEILHDTPGYAYAIVYTGDLKKMFVPRDEVQP